MNRTPSSGDVTPVFAVTPDNTRGTALVFYGPEYSDSLVSAPRTAPLSSELSSDFDVRDPVLAVLLDVQRGRIGALTALYRIRRIVALP